MANDKVESFVLHKGGTSTEYPLLDKETYEALAKAVLRISPLENSVLNHDELIAALQLAVTKLQETDSDASETLKELDERIAKAQNTADSNAKKYSAVNEVVENEQTKLADEIERAKDVEGDLSDLNTVVKNNLVAAINYLLTRAEKNSETIGTLTDLKTNEKTDVVKAINELEDLKANQTEVDTITTKVDNTVTKVEALENTVNNSSFSVEATNEKITALQKTVASKANQSGLTALSEKVTTNEENIAKNAQAITDLADTVADTYATKTEVAAKADATEVNTLKTTVETHTTEIGDLSTLTTTAKDTLVEAINEAAASGGGSDTNIITPLKVETAPSAGETGFAIGNGAQAIYYEKEYGIAIGDGAQSYGDALAIGINAIADALEDGGDYYDTFQSLAVGNYSASSAGGIAIGTGATAEEFGLTIGNRAEANKGIAIGADSKATSNAAEYPVAIGADACATGGYSVALGYKSQATEDYVVSVGGEYEIGTSDGTEIREILRRITYVSEPKKPTDAANKNYVDSKVAESATTVDQTFSATSENAQSGVAVAEAISGITGMKFSVVTSLPTTGENGTIYLVAHEHGTDDSYDEYIWLESASKFEKIGSTDVDLTGYLKKSDMDEALDALSENPVQNKAIIENASDIIDAITADSTALSDSNYVVTNTNSTAAVRSPLSAIWSYIQSKIESVLGITKAKFEDKADKANTVKSVAISGTTMTVTKGDGTTNDLTTQDTTYAEATSTAAGLMSASDKAKLEGIADGATKITVDSEFSETSTNPVQNKAIYSLSEAIIDFLTDLQEANASLHEELLNLHTEVFSRPATRRLETKTLSSNGGTLSWTNAYIDYTSLIEVYATIPNITPTAIKQSESTVTVTFGEQNSAFAVAIVVM